MAFLNTREMKRIKEKLVQQFGAAPAGDYGYYQGSNNRLWLVSKEILQVDLTKLRIDRLGLYFAEIMNDESVRLSKEGSQLLAQEAQKKKHSLQNAIALTKEEVRSYFQGNNLDKDLGQQARFVLLFYNKDCLGCAKYKEGTILNFLPKIHRGEVIL